MPQAEGLGLLVLCWPFMADGGFVLEPEVVIAGAKAWLEGRDKDPAAWIVMVLMESLEAAQEELKSLRSSMNR